MIIGITDGNKDDLTNLAKMTKKAVIFFLLHIIFPLTLNNISLSC